MSRVWTVIAFVVAMAIVMVGFEPVGNALGELAFDLFEGSRESGSSESVAAILPLIGIDLAALFVVFTAAFVGGVRLPSGLLQLFFALFVPLMLGVMQARFFAIAEVSGGLASAFGTYNFVAMFALSLAAAQLGVHLSRKRYEGSLG